MKILFITNYYPPSNHGWGYMQLCEEVADGLAARGHEIAVLTSQQRDGAEIDRPYPVYRLLTIEPAWHSRMPAAWQFFVGRRRRERQAIADLQRLVDEFRPQVIFVWHAVGLPRVMLQAAEAMSEAVTVFYLAGYLPELPDEYVAYWRQEPVRWSARLLKRSLAVLALWQLRREGKPLTLRYEHVLCVSAYVRDRLVSQKLISADALVVHNGIDPGLFDGTERQKPAFSDSVVSFIVAGRLMAEKGVHTVIDAFALLYERGFADISLTLLGGGDAAYLARLRRQVAQAGLQQKVQFRAPVLRDQMPDILVRHDALILPSEYDEPLARAMQEAMAMGLLVIGTTTGGSGELLVHGRTGLAFEAGDAGSLAGQIARAVREPELARRLAQAGQQEVLAHFTTQHTVQRIEDYLRDLVRKRERV